MPIKECEVYRKYLDKEVEVPVCVGPDVCEKQSKDAIAQYSETSVFSRYHDKKINCARGVRARICTIMLNKG